MTDIEHKFMRGQGGKQTRERIIFVKRNTKHAGEMLAFS